MWLSMHCGATSCNWQARVLQEPKHLAHVTSKLKNKYRLLPKDMLGAVPTGVNMSLLAYAGPYGAIGQSIRYAILQPICIM